MSNEIPTCACAEHYPSQGHPPDCPVRQKVETLQHLLSNLYALVLGECPRLLDGDRGGNEELALAIENELPE